MCKLQRLGSPPAQQRLAAAGRWGVLLLMILFLPACSSSPLVEQTCKGWPIVIGFAPAVDAAHPGTAASLSDDAGVTIFYMRPLFDNYHLYCAGQAGAPPLTDAMLQRLRERTDTLSVEADVVRHPLRTP